MPNPTNIMILSLLILHTTSQILSREDVLNRNYLKNQKQGESNIQEHVLKTLSLKSNTLHSEKHKGSHHTQLECKNGLKNGGSCQCFEGWIGDSCQSRIRQITSPSIHLLASDVEYFSVSPSISSISINWAENRLYLVDPQNTHLLYEVLQKNPLPQGSQNKERLYKVTGKTRNTISFSEEGFPLAESYFLMVALPALLACGVYAKSQWDSMQQRKKSIKVCSGEYLGEGQCAICLTNDPFGLTIVLECNHVFHKACLSNWVAAKDNCPYCRSAI